MDHREQSGSVQGEPPKERVMQRRPRAAEGQPQEEPAQASPIATESISQAKRVIDQIEQRINEAYRVPLKKGLCVVDTSAIIDLIGQLRIALPKSVVQAAGVMESREQILESARQAADKTADEADEIYKNTVGEANRLRDEIHAEADAYQKEVRHNAEEDAKAMIADAQTRAEQILYAAQQQAQQMVEDNEISRRAQAYALEIRDSAQKDAQSIYEQACVQTDKLLSGAAASLTRSANDLAALRDELLGRGGSREY